MINQKGGGEMIDEKNGMVIICSVVAALLLLNFSQLPFIGLGNSTGSKGFTMNCGEAELLYTNTTIEYSENIESTQNKNSPITIVENTGTINLNIIVKKPIIVSERYGHIRSYDLW